MDINTGQKLCIRGRTASYGTLRKASVEEVFERIVDRMEPHAAVLPECQNRNCSFTDSCFNASRYCNQANEIHLNGKSP